MTIRLLRCGHCGHMMRYGKLRCGYCRHAAPMLNWAGVVLVVIVAAALVFWH